MGGKKWCEYCRINIEYTRQAIQAHEQTRLHEQNKQRSIKHQMHQNRKEANAARKLNNQAKKNGQKIETSVPNVPSTPSSHPPKPKVSEERLMEYRKQQDEFKSEAFSKIHSLIAQKTKGEFGAPVQFPENNLLLLKDSYYDKHTTTKPKLKESASEADSQEEQDDGEEVEEREDLPSGSEDSEDVRMWRIERCEETGKACFVNNITGTKLYDRPVGFVLSDKEQEAWQQLQQHIEENPQQDPNEQGNVGEWQEVPEQQDYFRANALPQEQSEQEVEQLADIQRPRALHEQQLGEIEKKILKGQITSADQVVGLMIASATEQTGESLRQKNAKLKKLIECNFEETIRMDKAKQSDRPYDDQIKKVEGFRPRKQVKKVQLTTEEDLY